MRETYKRVELLQQAFTDSLTVEATKRLLLLGSEPELYVKNRRDTICIFYLNGQLYAVGITNHRQKQLYLNYKKETESTLKTTYTRMQVHNP